MANRKRRYFKGKTLRIPVSVQEKYTGRINALVARMTKETEDKITALFNSDFVQEHFTADASETVDWAHLFGVDGTPLGAPSVGTMDASTASQVRILVNALKRRWDKLFGDLAFGLSPWMADSINRASASGVAGSVKDMPNLRTEGRKLSIDVKKLDKKTLQILKTASAMSSSFITSIPETHLNKVADAVYKSITSGNGMQDLKPFFDKQNSSIKNYAHNTAMDQTRKAYNGLNIGRMHSIGITKGEWVHSGGSNHPRPLHEEFDGQTFDLAVGAPVGDYGGNNVSPGEEPNCRCTFAPVVEYDNDLDAEDDSD